MTLLGLHTSIGQGNHFPSGSPCAYTSTGNKVLTLVVWKRSQICDKTAHCTTLYHNNHFTSEFGVAPQHQEPLTRLLKKTINHVKSFLGEFERKIKDSRLIVREIHNQSLLSNNCSTIATTDNIATGQSSLNQDPKMREEEDKYDDENKSVKDDLNEDTVKVNTVFIRPPAVSKSPKGHIIIAQRRATTVTPLTNFIRRDVTRFKIEKELNFRQDWLKTEVFRTTANVRTTATFTKHRKRLMRKGPARFQSQELYDPQGNPINPILFFKGFKFFNTIKTNPKRLIGPAQFKSEERVETQRTVYPRVTLRHNITTKSINTTKPTNQITHEVIKTNQSKDKIDNKTRVDDKEMIFRAIELAKATIKPKKKPLHTLSDFHFRLKENIFSEPTQQYPDIFLRGVDRKSTPPTPTVRKTTTRYFPQLFTTTVIEHIGGVIPEFTKDYQNVNFRAQSSDEDNSPIPNSHKLPNHQSYTKKQSHEPKKLTPKNMDTTKDITDKLANEHLRKIIAASSYSLSDEETYLKVNLLDQLYHYNKTLNESEADKSIYYI